MRENYNGQSHQRIWVGDAPTSRILKFDLNGNFLYSWGAPGGQVVGLTVHTGSQRINSVICTWQIASRVGCRSSNRFLGRIQTRSQDRSSGRGIRGNALEPEFFREGAADDDRDEGNQPLLADRSLNYEDRSARGRKSPSQCDLSTAAGHATSAAVELQRAPADRKVNRPALDLIDERLSARIRPQHAA